MKLLVLVFVVSLTAGVLCYYIIFIKLYILYLSIIHILWYIIMLNVENNILDIFIYDILNWHNSYSNKKNIDKIKLFSINLHLKMLYITNFIYYHTAAIIIYFHIKKIRLSSDHMSLWNMHQILNIPRSVKAVFKAKKLNDFNIASLRANKV